MPRSVVVDLFVSLDGWAGSDGLPPYFGHVGSELQDWILAESAEPEVQLMGRTTYELLSALPPDLRDDGWTRMERQEKVVFSRSLTSADWANTRLSSDLLDEVGRLRAGDGPRLRTIGSLSVARQLLDAGLVDVLRLMVFPLVAGPAGREPAFRSVGSTDLDLVDSSVLDGRLLLLTYRPSGRDIPRW